jgi:hypothetical protein
MYVSFRDLASLAAISVFMVTLLTWAEIVGNIS